MSSPVAATAPVPPADAPRPPAGDRVRGPAVILALLIGAGLIYGQSAGFEFINYDDQEYVYENAVVRGGLSWESFRWAWTTGHAANWHPLTWLSHLLDVELFGLWAGGHHLTSVAFHAANAVLLFVLFRRLAGRFWPAAFVAAFFAWHPLRAESVAWVAERKDVLSTFFGLLSLLAYERYVRADRSARWFVSCLLALAASLASKGMLVTMPFLMLLLDVWPLRRLDAATPAERRRQFGRLVVEKLPVFGVVVAIAVATFVSQSDGGAVMARSEIAAPQRVLNAIVSVLRYVGMTFAPADLAPYYPHPYAGDGGGVSTTLLIGAMAFLLATCAFAFGTWRRWPFVATGWFWFLGTLVPVIGLVQVGNQALADRYTYVPGIGIGLLVAFTLDSITRGHRVAQRFVSAIACVGLVALAIAAHRQASYWRDSVTLMRRGAEAVPNSFVAHNNLGAALDARGEFAAAEPAYRAALAIAPTHPGTNINLAGLLLRTGRVDEATPLIETAMRADPSFAPAYIARADQRLASGDASGAFADYAAAIRLNPREKRAFHNYALALAQAGKYDAAKLLWRDALAIDPFYENALNGLGRTLLVTGETAGAYATLRQAIAMNPANASARYVLAWSLATNADPARRDPSTAAALARQALAIEPDNPLYIDTFAAALAAGGRFAEAVQAADVAAARADASGNGALAASIRARAARYREGKPYVAAGR